MGHEYIGHTYIGHTCIGHTCIGHTYIGHTSVMKDTMSSSVMPPCTFITRRGKLSTRHLPTQTHTPQFAPAHQHVHVHVHSAHVHEHVHIMPKHTCTHSQINTKHASHICHAKPTSVQDHRHAIAPCNWIVLPTSSLMAYLTYVSLIPALQLIQRTCS